MRVRRLALVVSALAAWVLPGSACAQTSTEPGTLAKIRAQGSIYLGYREDVAPFSYFVDGKPGGYTVEICQRVVDEIRRRLALPDLRQVTVPMPANLRYTMVADGIADLECGASANTRLSQVRVAFSVAVFESMSRFLVARDSSLQKISDLDGKTVIVGAATTAGRVVSNAAKRRNITIRVISARDRDSALAMLAEGRGDAYFGDDALLLGATQASPYADRFRLIDDAVSAEPYGIVMRRDDPEFKKLVDDALIDLMKSGEMHRLYEKWFIEAIPPRGKRIGLPMSKRLQELFTTPDDRGVNS